MVTDAAFVDLNKDGFTDLVLAGEWMPVQLLINHEGKFSKAKELSLTGLWQSLTIADIDGDGRADILAGNYGLNTKLHASTGSPLKLYVGDFDKNGTIDQLLTYTVGKKEYSFLGKDELEKQLPGLRKQFLKYTDFAGKTVQEVFGQQLKGAEVLTAASLSGGVLKNEGNGKFHFMPFPFAAQDAPIFAVLASDINSDGLPDVITGGNLFGVIPYEGRYDASWGTLMLGQKNGDLECVPPVTSGLLIRGEVRDIKKLKTARGWLYVVARNNEPLSFFRSLTESQYTGK